MMEALIAEKAQRLPNKYNLYPIHMAIESQNPRAVELIKSKKDINIKMTYGENILIIIPFTVQPELVIYKS